MISLNYNLLKNNRTIRHIIKCKLYWLLLAILAVMILVGVFLFGNSSFNIYNKKNYALVSEDANGPILQNINPITGIACANYNRRPLAVMMANDPVARPLSGISSADLIIEMPVITGSITRMMTVFICGEPSEIGAMRSARHDFIPLAMGFDSIFVHWGGSHFALDKLNRGIVDNINALYNPFGMFYRKSGMPAPHNGFTSYDRLWLAVKKLGYGQETDFEGYVFDNHDQCEICVNASLAIDYAKPYNVHYDYNFQTNSYLRFRYGQPELDKINNQQVEVKNVIVMRALSRQIQDQYNDVDIEGNGKTIFYKNGEEIFGRWEKDKNDMKSKLYFFDENGEEMKFAPGKIIIEIVEPYQRVEYTIKQ